MADVRHDRLERYEARAAECEILAHIATDHATQKQYQHLAAHYRYLAASFRDALAVHSAALARLMLH